MSTPITIKGNIATDIQTATTGSGKPVINFRVLVNNRTVNHQTGEFEEGIPTGFNCAAYGQLARNIHATATKGTTVLITGKIRTEQYLTKEGDKRTADKIILDDFGISLKYATATITGNPKSTQAEEPEQDEPTTGGEF